jgi:WD40 repeat protein
LKPFRLLTVLSLLVLFDSYQDNKAHLLKYENGNLKEDGILEGNKGPVTAVAISPDASKLVAGDVRIVNPPYLEILP